MSSANNTDHAQIMAHHLGDRIARQLMGQPLAPAAHPVWRAKKGRYIVEMNSGRWSSIWGDKFSPTLYPVDVAIGLDGMAWVVLYWETEAHGHDFRLCPIIKLWNRTWQEYEHPGFSGQAPVTTEMCHLFTTVDHAVEGSLLLPMSYYKPWRELAEQVFPPEAFERLRTLGWTGDFETDKANGVHLAT